jgi:hypothetical protein
VACDRASSARGVIAHTEFPRKSRGYHRSQGRLILAITVCIDQMTHDVG